MDGKKSSGVLGSFMSPTGLLKKGFNTLKSPIVAVKDTVVDTFSTPISSSSTPANTTSNTSSSTPSHGTRAAAPSPMHYPGLFDVRIGHSNSIDMDNTGGNKSGNTSRTNSRTISNVSSGSNFHDRLGSKRDELFGPEDVALMDEEERAYLSVTHHNLHSVLTNPKQPGWAEVGVDLLQNTVNILNPLTYAPTEQELIAIFPFPGLDLVCARDFEPYLKKYGQNTKIYQKNHEKPVEEQLSSSSVPSISVADEDVIKCLNVVPSLFFRPTYDFTDPAIFEEVMQMKTEVPLQEALSGYLDRVEFTLLRQVSSRSDRFFEASANQEVIRKSVTSACEQVGNLRRTMDRLRNGLADRSLDIVSLHRRQKRINELHEVVTMMESVKHAEAAIEALVHGHDYASALDLIETSQTTLREHLQGIHCMSSLHDKFQNYRGFIVTQMSHRFISIVSSPEWMFDEHEPTPEERQKEQETSLSRLIDEEETVNQAENGHPTTTANNKTTTPKKKNLTKELKELIQILYRLDALNDVIGKYRDQLNEEIKVVVKTVVTETIASSSSQLNPTASTTSTSTDASSSSSSSSGGGGVSVQLRALTSDEFLNCVQMIFEHLLMTLKRGVVLQNLLVSAMQVKIQEASSTTTTTTSTSTTTTTNTPATTNWSPSDSVAEAPSSAELGDWKNKTKGEKIMREIEDVIKKTCEFSQRSVSNLFSVRKDVQAVYTMPQLRKIYDTTMEFVVALEKLTGKTDYTLRGALFSQLKLFLEKYHQVQMGKLVSTLDHELWKNAEISVSRHKALEDLSSGRGVSLILSEDREVIGDTAPPFKAVAICGKTFRIVWSVLLMLEIVMNYMSCASNFPVLATDVLQRSIEIFRLFNSRTTQLVLGAGAMQIARLKSISARHLALASQSLDLAMTLIPHIKAALAAHFTDRQKLLLEEFDRVFRDYVEHNEKIFHKFTNIVEEQIMKRFLENVAVEVDYDIVNEIPSKPMVGIAQSTLKLHQVLQPVLSPVQMKDVMTRVFDMFTQKLPECFQHVQPKTPAGKKRVLEDIQVFTQSFKEVPEVEFRGDTLLRQFHTNYHI